MAPYSNASIGTPWLKFTWRAATLLLVVLAGSPAARAQLAWVGNTSTDWTDATNWNPAVAPDPTQTVLIDTAVGNQPVLSGNVGSANIVTVGSDANSSGNTSLTVNHGASLTTNNLILGADSGAFGALVVNNATTNLNITQNLTIGSNGTGTLNIGTGGSVTDDMCFIGANAGSTGTATFGGLNSNWVTNTLLSVGNAGNGTLNIGRLASLSAPVALTVGALAGATGVINLNGGTIDVGTGLLTVGANGTLAGNGTVKGNATVIGGALSLNAVMDFQQGISLDANSTTSFSLSGNTSGNYGALVTASGLALAGNAVITLANGFVPATGDTFTLLQSGGNLTGNFSNIIAPPGIALNTSNLAINGTVTVVFAFLTEPTNQVAGIGQTANFTVVVAGNPVPTIQWQVSTNQGAAWQNVVNGTDLATGLVYSGNTSGTLGVSNVSVQANGFLYRAVATTSAASAISSVASLTVADSWLGTTSQAWLTALNWSPHVPLATDNAVINIGATQNTTTTSPFSNTTNIGVGNTSTVNNLVIGNDNTSTGPSLTVSSSGTLNANLTIIGNGPSAGGSLVLTGSTFNSNATTVGNSTGSTGSVTLSGGATWLNAGDILVGNLGTGSLSESGSTVTATGNIIIGNLTTATLSATTGTITADGNMVIGTTGHGVKVTLSNGTLKSLGITSIGNASSVVGKGTFAGNVTCDGSINPTPSSSTTPIPSGLIAFNQNLALTSNSVITIALTGPTRGTQYSGLNVGGNFAAGGTFNLTTPFGFVPGLGQTYNVFQVGGGFSGTFANFTFPQIEGGLGWDFSHLSTNGTVAVVSVITTEPADQSAQLFQSVSFTVATSGTPAPTFQWQVSQNQGSTWTNVYGGPDSATGIIYAGTTTGTLTVGNVSASVSGFEYRALLTNPAASAVSDAATLTVDAILNWAGNTSTNWTDATNWNPAFVPDITLTALINTGSGNQPMLSGNNAIANIVIVGNDANSTASTSLTLNAAADLITNNLYLGFTSTGTGAAVVTDANTTANVGQAFAVGWNGTGTLTVANGANITDTLGYVGANFGSTGTATITGTNSTWTSSGGLNVGFVGNGTLNVANGATVFSPSLISVATLGSSNGLINLANATLGVGPTGLITVNSKGTLAGNGTILGNTTVAGTFSPNGLITFSQELSFTANATLNFPLGGNSTGTYGAVTTNSSIVLGGNIVITLVNGFVPAIGDNFTLFQAGGGFISSFNTIIPPAIPGGLGLDTSSLSVNGTVTAISVITSQTPADGNETLSETQSGNLSVVAPDAIKFQWQQSLDGGVTWTDLTDKTDSHITGTKTDTLDLTKVTLDMSGREFRCLVTTDVAIAFSNTFILTVIPSFTVVSQPVSQSVYINTPVTFSINVTSPLTPLTTQWYKNGKLIPVTGSNGANTPTLNLGDVTKANNGTYTAVVSYAGNATINATSIGSNLVVLTVAKVPAKVIIQPLNVTTKVGRSIYFRAYANGDQTKTFQWQFSATGTPPWNNLTNGTGTIIGNVTVSGATSTGGSYTTLRLSGVNDNDDVGFYRLMVSNPANIAISGTAAFSKAVSLTVTN